MSRRAIASSSRSVHAAWAISPATGTTAWHSECDARVASVAGGDLLGGRHGVRARRADLVGAREHGDRVHRGAGVAMLSLNASRNDRSVGWRWRSR